MKNDFNVPRCADNEYHNYIFFKIGLGGSRAPQSLKNSSFWDILYFFSLLLVILNFEIFFITFLHFSVTFMTHFRIVEPQFIAQIAFISLIISLKRPKNGYDF